MLGTRPLVETQRGVNLFLAYMNDIIVSQMKKMISPMSRELIDPIIISSFLAMLFEIFLILKKVFD